MCRNLRRAVVLCILLFPLGELKAGGNGARPGKIGLALSGGGARGAAHIGVLKVLEREGIPIDCIAGTSFGALVGGLYAVGYRAQQIEDIFVRQDWNSMFSDAPERRLAPLSERKNFRYQAQLALQGVNPEFPAGLWVGQRMTQVLNALTTERMIQANYDFDRLRIPFRAVATDLLTGKPYVFERGPMTEALRASIAIPMLFTPVEKENMLLVDGGLANNLPTDIVRQMGADIVIAIDVSTPLMPKHKIRTFVDVMDQAMSLLMRQSVEEHARLVDLMIRPDLETYTYSDYRMIAEISRLGEKAALDRLPEVRTLVASIPQHEPLPLPGPATRATIGEITFAGLERLDPQLLRKEVRSRPGQPLDTETLSSDLSRLYATNMVAQVDTSVQPMEGGRYRLTYVVKESPLNTLGASIRYDRDYDFVALAELTLRRLFGTPSVATVSSQFGGLENHMVGLRYISPKLPQLYLEPKVHLRRRERLDMFNEQIVDRYSDRRIGGQFMVGATLLRRLEFEMGYRNDRVSIHGGTAPNRQDEPIQLAGLTFRLTRDTLDSQNFAKTGMLVRFQVDKRSERLAGDVSYSKWQLGAERHFTFRRHSTVQLYGAAGYTRGAIPFYDRFFLGGYNFSDGSSRHLAGFSRDEFSANQMGVLGGLYRYQLFSHPLSFTKRGFLTAMYNLAAVSERQLRPYRFEVYNGAAAGVELDTLLGPVRLLAGWGEGGRGRVYVTFGPGF